jgi:hypothetical protein
MTVNDIIPRLKRDSQAEARKRLSRLAALVSDRMTEALTWLAGDSPMVFDAMLDATEPCADDDTPDPADNPEPFCAVCGADVGIFLRFGLDWRHYRGDGTTVGLIELFDPGHAAVIAWRPALSVSESAAR